MTRFLTITTSTEDRAVADAIARAMIDRRLGACARIHQVESVYRWEGAVCVAQEFVVEVKTTEARRPEVEAAIRELHNYDLPEIVAHEILGGSAAYLHWIETEVAEAS